MVKTTTLTELEPSDIHWTKDDPEMDDVHSSVAGALLLMFIVGVAPAPGQSATDKMTELVATFLNYMADMGIVITKSELPSAVTDAFRAGGES